MENMKRTEQIATSHDPQAPRVSLEQVLNSIDRQYFFHPAQAVDDPNHLPKTDVMWTMTICVSILKNGWAVVGKTAPASPENYDAHVGEKLAHEDCVRQIWPLLGFMLRQAIANSGPWPGEKQ